MKCIGEKDRNEAKNSRFRYESQAIGYTPYMNEILRPYAILAIMYDSERKVNRRFLIAYGRGETRRQNVTI